MSTQSNNSFSAFDMGQYTQNFMKQMEDMMSMGQKATDAMVQSSTIFAKGMENVMQICAVKAQDANEKNAHIWQSLMTCKSVNEFAEMQNKLAQDGFDNVMSVSAEMSEASVKCMMETLEPINKQMSGAMQKAGNAMAA